MLCNGSTRGEIEEAQDQQTARGKDRAYARVAKDPEPGLQPARVCVEVHAGPS